MEKEKNDKSTPSGAALDSNPASNGPSESLVSAAVNPPKKTVEVDSDMLQKVLARVEKLEDDNKILREVADKNRLGRVEELRAQGKLVKSVNLNVFEGKIVVAWKTIRNDVYQDTKGILHEDQVVGLIFEGETGVGKEIDIRAFARLMVKVSTEVIEEGKDKDGNINFTVLTKDGRQIKIDSKFIN